MIKLENVSKTYDLDDGEKIQALKNINLQVKEGEVLGIIGKSGSGKSTLLRVLRGVETIDDDGIITIDDVTVKGDSSQYYYNMLKKKTAIHLQRSFGLWPETVRENILRKLYGAIYNDEALTDFDDAESMFSDEVDKILELVSLTDKSNHYAPVLSGGEKQRLIIARQLAKKPKVLLLDEPATMACPKTKQEILDAVKKINEELNITVVIVSHLPEIHNYLADRVLLVEDGEITKEGSPSEITGEFLHDMDPVTNIKNVSTDEDILTIEDLYKKFFLLSGGNVLEMEDVSLKVQKENILSLVGPSGAGKTVLLRMMAGLDFPETGKILYKLNEDWVKIDVPGLNRMKIRSKLGFMHQEFALAHYATVLDQLSVKLGFKNQDVVKKAKEKALETGLSDELLDSLYLLIDLPEHEARTRLEQIGLAPNILDELFPKFPESATKEAVKDIFEKLDLPLSILNRKSYELSGGQKVRVMLALILISQPNILLLDEPFGDLDPVTLRTVNNSLKKFAKESNITIIMVSHNTDFIKEISNRSVFMDNGKILKEGNPSEIVPEFIDFCKATYLTEE